MPTPMRIREGDFKEVAKAFRQTSKLARQRRANGSQVRYFVPPEGHLDASVNRPLPVQQIILPRYDPSQETKLSAIDKGEAVRFILSECAIYPAALDPQAVAEFVQWFRDIECYQLTLASIADAVKIAKRISAGHEVAAGQSIEEKLAAAAAA